MLLLLKCTRVKFRDAIYLACYSSIFSFNFESAFFIKSFPLTVFAGIELMFDLVFLFNFVCQFV